MTDRVRTAIRSSFATAGEAASMATAFKMTATPKVAISIVRILGILLVVLILILIFVPWQQTVEGAGSVTPFAPYERAQSVRASISGRITRWYINEGARVRRGDTLAVLVDIKPEYMPENLTGTMEEILRNTSDAQAFAITSSKQKVEQIQQKVLAARAKYENALVEIETARIRLRRAQELRNEGLISEQDMESARLRMQKAVADSVDSRSSLQGVDREYEGAQNDLLQKMQDAQVKVAETRVKLQSIQQRRSAGVVLSPADGYVTRIAYAGYGETVKEGDQLALLVPDTDDRAIEMFISARDAAIVDTGRPVRVRFQGYPAFLFSGFPNLAIGTFPGRVAVVDAVDNGKGKYRVLVVPDTDSKQEWPEPHFLRQGTPANAWILLSEVSIGFEIWRQLNGFPPMLPTEYPTDLMPKSEGKK